MAIAALPYKQYEKAFVDIDWDFDQAMPNGADWSRCNTNQNMCISDTDAHLFACPNAQSGRVKYVMDTDDIWTLDGVDYYRAEHIFSQHRHLLIREVAFNGTMMVQFEITDVNRWIKKVDAWNIAGTKIFTDTYNSDEHLTASSLAFDILDHVIRCNINVSRNVHVVLLKAGDDPTEITGSTYVINPRDERRKRARTSQKKITDFFG